MHNSFRALVAALATACAFTTASVLYNASLHSRGFLYHSSLNLSRVWIVATIPPLIVTFHYLFAAYAAHEWDLPFGIDIRNSWLFRKKQS